ncbi:VCBS domain-containing protein, partial [Sneathiella glossodoripedis]|uniref:VCBS domain-containing protein n=1 Tax=Sneathiella glossodoripedis TaxID=418853 RepID=UPI001902BCBD
MTEDADLTASGKLTAEDVDAGESGFVAGSIAGVYGELSIDAAGNWAYTANDSAELQALGADDVVSDTLVVTTPDGTTHTITVTLEGVNDMPVITGVDTGSVAEDGPLQTTGKLAADDVDAGESGFAPGLVQGVYGVLSIDAAGNWAYNASGNTALQALGTGDVTAEKLTVFTVDGTAHVINISVSGSDDAAVISGVDTGVVEEDGVLTASGKLNAEDADAGESGFTAASVSGAYGMLVIDAAGNWTYTANDTPALQALGAGDVVTDTVVVKSIDGTTHNITISVEGSDDAPVISGVDTGVVEEDGVLTASGKLTADDADAGQSGFMAETVAGVYGELSIDAAGNWTYTAHDTAELQALGKGEMVTDTLTVATTDGTQKQILININGKD